MDLIKTLEQLSSNDNNIRRNSEALISKLADEDFYNYLLNLSLILTGENYQLNIRQMASTLIKNPIVYVTKYKDMWKNLDKDQNEKIKQLILSALGSSNEFIRKSAGSIVSSIAKIENPISEKWSTLLPVLCNSKFDNLSFQLAAIQTLGYICEESDKSDLLSGEIDQMLSAFVMAIKNNINQQNVVELSLKGLVNIFPLVGSQKMAMQQYSDLLMNEIINVGNVYSTNNKILELICRVFIELAENYYNVVGLYLDKICPFTFSLMNCNEERLIILGFEFWCRLGNEELNKYKLSQTKNNQNLCKYYFQQNSKNILEYIDKYIVLPPGKEDLEDDWNPSKSSCYILVILVQVCEMSVIEGLCEEIRSKFF
jgi:hypothetical protein